MRTKIIVEASDFDQGPEVRFGDLAPGEVFLDAKNPWFFFMKMSSDDPATQAVKLDNGTIWHAKDDDLVRRLQADFVFSKPSADSRVQLSLREVFTPPSETGGDAGVAR